MWQKYEEVNEIKDKCEIKSMQNLWKMEYDWISMWIVLYKKKIAEEINELE